ncbi:MAG: hypothetical protein PHW07_06840, partial [Sulfurospirillaceae bacterium]|nr:hypothetical protein [Sulfurospirillaceae bacterium]
MLKINPVVSEKAIGGEHIDANGIPFLAPDIKIKQLSSMVKVKDGNKVLVGGLISRTDTVRDTSVPGLSSIPFLGEAFKSSSKVAASSELIIVIIPHVVEGLTTPDLEKYEMEFAEKIN